MTPADLMRLADDGGPVPEHSPWPDPDCPDCYGAGEFYTHSPDCRERFCALAGGYHDCDGEVVTCGCNAEPPDWPMIQRVLMVAARKAGAEATGGRPLTLAGLQRMMPFFD